jgi:DNA-binding CsgD family transcriptional regulator
MATESVGPKAAPGKRAAATPEQLLKQLLAHAADPCCGGLPDDGSRAEEVLLDMDLDGARYLLLRLPKPETSRVLLSPREQEIVRMVAQGHCNKVIAGVLSISSWTVCTHLRRIFAKLGVGSRAAMIARFMETDRAAGRKAAAVGGSMARVDTAERTARRSA